jgi:hypothetical protein
MHVLASTETYTSKCNMWHSVCSVDSEQHLRVLPTSQHCSAVETCVVVSTFTKHSRTYSFSCTAHLYCVYYVVRYVVLLQSC